MCPSRHRLGWLAGCAVLAWSARAAEVGQPLIRNFSPGDYQGQRQILSATPTPEGTMLFGGQNWVVEYDGQNWHQLDLPGIGPIYALAEDAEGSIWVAGNNELGRVRRRPDGQLAYVSLRNLVPPEAGDLGPIRNIRVTPTAVWFQSSRSVLVWRGGEFSLWLVDPHSEYHTVWLDDRLLISQSSGWSIAAAGGPAERVGRPEDQLGRYQPLFAVPSPRGGWLLGLKNRDGDFAGLGRFDGTSLTLLSHPLDDFFKTKRLTFAHQLADGRYFFATALGGAVLLDRELQPLALLDEHSGLESSAINCHAIDPRGDLWLGTDWGVSHIQMHAAYSWFGRTQGLPRGGANALTRRGGQLLVGGAGGILQHRPPATATAPSFFRWEGIDDRINRIISTSLGEVAAGSNGAWMLTPSGDRLGGTGEIMDMAETTARRLFATTPRGLGTWHQANGHWVWDGFIPEPRSEMGDLAAEADGSLWIGAPGQTVWHIQFTGRSAEGLPEAVAQRLGREEGLPAGFGWTRLYRSGDRVLFATTKGLFRYDPAGRRFVPENSYGQRFNNSSTIIRAFAAEPDGAAFVLAQPARTDPGYATLQLGRAHGEDWQEIPVPGINRLGGADRLFHETSEGRELLWILGQSSLLRIDLTTLAEHKPAPLGTTLLRSITLANGRILRVPPDGTLRLQADENSVHLTYATPGLAGESEAWHETQLSGLGDGSLEMDHGAERTFNRLPAGNYVFQVRGRSEDGRWSRPAFLRLVIATAWWTTRWAWTGFGLLALGGIYAIVRLRTERLTYERNRLEQVVASRTAELARINTELRRINRLEHDEKLAARLAGEKAQLEMLRYQLNPHFLYNALNSIRALIFTSAESAAEMVTRLSEFCRRTLSQHTEGLVPVAEEIEMIRNYLDIEQARWQSGLITRVEVDPAAQTEPLPQFMLLPLVENAIKYGGRTSPGVLQVRINVSFEHGILICEVSNTGRWLDRGTTPYRESTGIGLENLRQRLTTFYGAGAVMETREQNGWVVARLRLPRSLLRGTQPPFSQPTALPNHASSTPDAAD